MAATTQLSCGLSSAAAMMLAYALGCSPRDAPDVASPTEVPQADYGCQSTPAASCAAASVDELCTCLLDSIEGDQYYECRSHRSIATRFGDHALQVIRLDRGGVGCLPEDRLWADYLVLRSGGRLMVVEPLGIHGEQGTGNRDGREYEIVVTDVEALDAGGLELEVLAWSRTWKSARGARFERSAEQLHTICTREASPPHCLLTLQTRVEREAGWTEEYIARELERYDGEAARVEIEELRRSEHQVAKIDYLITDGGWVRRRVDDPARLVEALPTSFELPTRPVENDACAR